MKFLLLLMSVFLLLSGCSSDPEPVAPPESDPPFTETQPTTTEAPDPIQLLMESMSLEEQVGQLFLVRCNIETALEDIAAYHPGGFVLFGVDFENQTPESVTRTIHQYQQSSKIPLLIAVDEEGGTVTRVSRYPAFRETAFPSPRRLFDQGGMELVLETEAEKAKLLSSLGINVNLAPVCDITTDPDAFLYDRSLGQDATTTSLFVSETVGIMHQHHVGSTLKHFPGYGNNADTHIGIAVDSRSLADLEAQDLIPFQAGIDAGADAVMVSHSFVQCLDPNLPASLSPAVHQYLRQQMDFDGVIMTDDLFMEAITDEYGAGEAAVLAVLAGNDLLCSTEYAVQYEAVLDSVLTGRIDYDLIHQAVRRVLLWKQELGLI